MKNLTKVLGAVIVAASLVLAVSACSDGGTTTRNQQLNQSQKKFDKRTPPDVTGDTEYNNYMDAQKIYDNPNTIIWCTASFPSSASPIFTVPIQGKLTSSSVSYYPGSSVHFGGTDNSPYITENQSVDGMYHGSPPPYRYGFTPGAHAYVDFSDLALFCTTAVTEFQRQNIGVTASASQINADTKKAEEQLKAGDDAGAAKTLAPYSAGAGSSGK